MRPPSLTVEHALATRERLLDLVVQVRGARVGVKIAAVLMLIDGQPAGRISRALGLTRMSLGRWVHGVNEEGIEHLLPKNRPGRPPALTPKIRREVAAHLKRPPGDFGFNREQWDGPTLVAHLKKRFGIALKVRQAQNWMHRLGYRLEHSGTEKQNAVAPRHTRSKASEPAVLAKASVDSGLHRNDGKTS
jgi:transposase